MPLTFTSRLTKLFKASLVFTAVLYLELNSKSHGLFTRIRKTILIYLCKLNSKNN